MRTAVVLLLLFFSGFYSEATHLRCGYIKLTRTGELTYQVSLIVFTNLGSPIKFGDGVLDFGDGSKTFITPTIDNTPRPDLASNVATVVFAISHTFPKSDTYTITYTEANLNAGITNVFNSVETKFYLETFISLEASSDCSSPDFLVAPIFKQPVGQEYKFSTAAMDKNDYQLTYELVNPLEPGNANFSMPENMSINYYNGLVTWDTKYKNLFQIGEYLFAVRVTQYNSGGERVGYTIQTFQVILQDADSQIGIAKPTTDPNGKIVVENGKKKTIKVLLDNTKQPADWIAVYDNKISNNFTFLQYDSIAGTDKLKVGVIKINSMAEIVRNNPYAITLRAKSIVSGEVFSSDISYLLFTKDIPLSLITEVEKQEGNNEIEIYPNPFSHYLKIDYSLRNAAIQVDFLNTSGQLVFTSKVNRNEPMQTSHLPPGFYILRVKTEKGMKTYKVIKAKE